MVCFLLVTVQSPASGTQGLKILSFVNLGIKPGRSVSVFYDSVSLPIPIPIPYHLSDEAL